ncbi:hypothetical protein [Rhizobium sp. PAMB 3182]
MKGSLVTSAVLHCLLLAAALFTLSAPKSFEVADVEALPVDIIPVESITQIQQGDEKAPKAQRAAPTPTSRPDPVENAQNIGDNSVDLKSIPTPDKRPQNKDSAAAPEKVDKVLPTKDNEQNDIKDIIKEDTVAAPKEVASIPEPKPEPVAKPEPQPTPQPAETTPQESDLAVLPDSVPLPASRPQPPKPEKPAEPEKKPTETAKKPAEKKPDAKVAEKTQEKAKAKSTKQSDFNADEVAALLNKQDPAGGGAKRSTDQAALGGKKTTAGSTLSQSEMDALRGQIQNNWSIIPGLEGAEGVTIRVHMNLDEDGNVVGEPVVDASGGSDNARRVLASGARRAILKSSPFKNLPRDKYDAWSEVIVNFDPSSML